MREAMKMSDQREADAKVHHFRYDATDLQGKRMRLVDDLPTSDAATYRKALSASLTSFALMTRQVSRTISLCIQWVGPTSWAVWSFVSSLCTTKRNNLTCPERGWAEAATVVYARSDLRNGTEDSLRCVRLSWCLGLATVHGATTFRVNAVWIARLRSMMSRANVVRHRESRNRMCSMSSPRAGDGDPAT